MNDVLLLRNPRAGRKRGPAPLPVETRLLDESFDPATCLGRELLVLEGGDGTLQRMLTGLFEAASGLATPDGWPAIAVLPAGTTNMSCADFNRSRRYHRALVRLRQVIEGAATDFVDKPVVRVDDGARTLHGFCFCLGIIVDAVRQFASARIGQPVVDNLAILGMVAKALLRTHSALQVGCDGKGVDTFAMVATTLDRLLYGMTPFVTGPHPTGLHTTWIEGGAHGLWRRLPALARGDADLFAQPGFRSVDVEGLELRFDGPFVIDGEMFRNPRNGVRISMSPPVRFMVL
jgi:diacylglycerol kinase family enzyme